MNSNIYNLLTGIDNTAKMVNKAIELAKANEKREIIWPDIPELYFEQAAKRFGIPDYR